jgi:hypothetical protein
MLTPYPKNDPRWRSGAREDGAPIAIYFDRRETCDMCVLFLTVAGAVISDAMISPHLITSIVNSDTGEILFVRGLRLERPIVNQRGPDQVPGWLDRALKDPVSQDEDQNKYFECMCGAILRRGTVRCPLCTGTVEYAISHPADPDFGPSSSGEAAAAAAAIPEGFVRSFPTLPGTRKLTKEERVLMHGNSGVHSEWQRLHAKMKAAMKHQERWNSDKPEDQAWRVDQGEKGVCHLISKPEVVSKWVPHGPGAIPPMWSFGHLDNPKDAVIIRFVEIYRPWDKLPPSLEQATARVECQRLWNPSFSDTPDMVLKRN